MIFNSYLVFLTEVSRINRTKNKNIVFKLANELKHAKNMKND